MASRHHTNPPSSATEPGSTSTVAMKIVRTCEPVRATVGNTSMGGFTTGTRSSWISQEMLPSAMSALAKYGKNELLPKSASPNTTSRNG